MDEALALMSRDAREAPLLVLFLLLPVALSIYAGVRGSRLAVVPLAVFAGQMSLWFAYYATDWFSNPGLAGAMAIAVLPTMGSLVLGVVAAVLVSVPQRRTESSPLAH